MVGGVKGAFVSIDGPGALATIASGVNAGREVVGRFNDAADCVRGFLLHPEGVLETLEVDVPGADLTVARGISDAGDILGMYRLREPEFPDRRHGFIRRKGQYVTLDYPGPPGTNTFAWNMNAAGVVVGATSFPGDGYREHGFVLTGGTWTQIDYPGALKTWASDIGSDGTIVGTWFDEAKVEHGFLLTEGIFAEVNVPGAHSNFFDAILDSGTTSGVYTDESTRARRGFVMEKDHRVTTIEYPGLTVVRDINARGDLVGRYVDAGKERGYVIWEGY